MVVSKTVMVKLGTVTVCHSRTKNQLYIASVTAAAALNPEHSIAWRLVVSVILLYAGYDDHSS